MKVEGVVTAWNGMLCLELTADSGGTYRRSSFALVYQAAIYWAGFCWSVGFHRKPKGFPVHVPTATAKTVFDLRNPRVPQFGHRSYLTPSRPFVFQRSAEQISGTQGARVVRLRDVCVSNLYSILALLELNPNLDTHWLLTSQQSKLEDSRILEWGGLKFWVCWLADCWLLLLRCWIYLLCAEEIWSSILLGLLWSWHF